MKPKHLLILAGAAVALLVVRSFLVGPEERIRRRLDELAAEASKDGHERPLVAAATARGLASYFTAEAVGEDPGDGARARGRDEIAQAIGWARESWPAGRVRFEELTIELAGPEAAFAGGLVRVEDPRDGSRLAEDGTRVELELVKEGGDWRIARAVAHRGGSQ